MRIQSEIISWNPTEFMNRPDVDAEVLICTDDGDLVIGYWDDSDEKWFETSGSPVIRPVYWANIKGPAV